MIQGAKKIIFGFGRKCDTAAVVEAAAGEEEQT